MKRLVCIVLVVLVPVFGWAFDKEHGKLQAFGLEPGVYRDLSDSVVAVMTIGTGLGWHSEDGNKFKARHGVFAQKGSGVVVRGRNGNVYVLTNYHVVIPSEVNIALSPNSSFITPILRVLRQFVFVGSWFEPNKVECEIVWSHQDSDLAILKPKKAVLLKPIPYETLWLNEGWEKLEKNDAVSVVTGYRDKDKDKEFPLLGIFPDRHWWYEVRHGKVLNTGPEVHDIRYLPMFSMYDVTVDVKIYPGDSGSPVFVYDKGKPYLIGLMRAFSCRMLPDGSFEVKAFFTRISDVAIRYMSAEGID